MKVTVRLNAQLAVPCRCLGTGQQVKYKTFTKFCNL